AATGAGLGQFVFQKTLRVFGIKSTTPRALLDFFDRGLKQFAHLQRGNARKFIFLMFEQGRGAEHELGAVRKWFASMLVKCPLGLLKSPLYFGIAEGAEFLQPSAGSRILL